MSLNSSYLIFKKTESRNGKDNYYITDKHDNILGYINYFSRWRKYVFTTIKDIIFDDICLAELLVFLENLNESIKRSNPSHD